jgi:predicted nucleic-acid-binding protein
VSLGLDTSVLVRLLIGEPAGLATKAKARLVEAHRLRQLVLVSDLVIAETYHALKHHYEIEPADISCALRAMFTSGLAQPESGSAVLAVLQTKTTGKAGFVDRLIQARYEADGVTTLTLDKAQAKIGRTELIG